MTLLKRKKVYLVRVLSGRATPLPICISSNQIRVSIISRFTYLLEVCMHDTPPYKLDRKDVSHENHLAYINLCTLQLVSSDI